MRLDFYGEAAWVSRTTAIFSLLMCLMQVYPWTSAHVLATLLVGAAILAVFVLWEIYGPMEEPLVPMKLFKDLGWVAACVLLGLGAR